VPSLSSVGNKNFNLSIPNQCLAYQVAALLNYNNRLTVVHSWQSIITNLNQYFIEVTGQMMIGCVGLQIGTKMDKILHLSVNISARHKGVGFRLLVTAVNNSNKDTIYMTIREDNFISIALAAKLGFKIIAYKPKYNYNVLTLCLFRRKNVTERAY
jgi:N-acetylglutamate synthase-like GNAT family acetyltransferase